MKKIALLFSDLEGTLIDTHTSRFEPQDMYAFLSKIEKFQAITGTEVHIHLVSPMYLKQMKKFMDAVDNCIHNFNQLHPDATPLRMLKGGTVTAEESFEDCYEVDRRIMPLPKDPDLRYGGRYGKEYYVKIFTDAYKKSNELAMAIYCGNDDNDSIAMEYIKSIGNGYNICPKNCSLSALKLASFTGEHDNLPGIVDGFGKLIIELDKSKSNEQNIDEVRE